MIIVVVDGSFLLSFHSLHDFLLVSHHEQRSEEKITVARKLLRLDITLFLSHVLWERLCFPCLSFQSQGSLVLVFPGSASHSETDKMSNHLERHHFLKFVCSPSLSFSCIGWNKAYIFSWRSKPHFKRKETWISKLVCTLHTKSLREACPGKKRQSENKVTEEGSSLILKKQVGRTVCCSEKNANRRGQGRQPEE